MAKPITSILFSIFLRTKTANIGANKPTAKKRKKSDNIKKLIVVLILFFFIILFIVAFGFGLVQYFFDFDFFLSARCFKINDITDAISQ
jgi:hypothetical protein